MKRAPVVEVVGNEHQVDVLSVEQPDDRIERANPDDEHTSFDDDLEELTQAGRLALGDEHRDRCDFRR